MINWDWSRQGSAADYTSTFWYPQLHNSKQMGEITSLRVLYLHRGKWARWFILLFILFSTNNNHHPLARLIRITLVERFWWVEKLSKIVSSRQSTISFSTFPCRIIVRFLRKSYAINGWAYVFRALTGQENIKDNILVVYGVVIRIQRMFHHPIKHMCRKKLAIDSGNREEWGGWGGGREIICKKRGAPPSPFLTVDDAT